MAMSGQLILVRTILDVVFVLGPSFGHWLASVTHVNLLALLAGDHVYHSGCLATTSGFDLYCCPIVPVDNTLFPAHQSAQFTSFAGWGSFFLFFSYVIPTQKVTNVLPPPEGHNWSIFEDLFQVGVIQQDVVVLTQHCGCLLQRGMPCAYEHPAFFRFTRKFFTEQIFSFQFSDVLNCSRKVFLFIPPWCEVFLHNFCLDIIVWCFWANSSYSNQLPFWYVFYDVIWMTRLTIEIQMRVCGFGIHRGLDFSIW